MCGSATSQPQGVRLFCRDNWIPNDPTLVAQILEDQFRLHAATAGKTSSAR